MADKTFYSMISNVAVLIVAVSMIAGCSGTNGAGNDTVSMQAVIEKIAPPVAAGTSEARSWSSVVAVTPEGAMLMGNPNAPIKIVEFASLTCSHCAVFSRESSEELKTDFIDSGRVSLEFHNFVRDSFDAVVAALTHCAGPERYFPLTESVLEAQEALIAGSQANSQAAQSAMSLSLEARYTALAKAWRIDQFFQMRGMTSETINICLSNLDNIRKLEQNTNTAMEKHNIVATPSFLINGSLARNVATWGAMRDRLRALGVR